MIDVVFLLLVFFMLASRFGLDAALPLPLAAGGGTYEGPPRLVDVTPNAISLNGQPVSDLSTALAPLMSKPSDAIILRGREGATLQRIVTVTETLQSAGYSSVVLVE